MINKIRILLIEEQETIAGEICRLLSEQHYQVDLAADGIMGKRLFDAHSYGLVLVDFDLPYLSGCELCNYIRKKNVHIPLIMMASETPDSTFDDLEAGIDDFIILSPDFRSLFMRIRALTMRSSHPIAESTRIESGDMVLNLISKEVIRGEQTIPLPTKEFQILEYLVRHKNSIVSRADIAFNIWGSRFTTKQDRLDVYMNSLRKKIRENDMSKRIYTVTRKGYILVENQE